MANMTGIETCYRGINFRSRLESRWACFFDECGWRWTYEPFDLPGWIPDFQIEGRILAEVKPFTVGDEWKSEAASIGRSLRRSGRKDEVALLGVSPRFGDREADAYGTVFLGWITDEAGEVDSAALMFDGETRTTDVSAVNGRRGDRLGLVNAPKGKFIRRPMPEVNAYDKWTESCNSTRWNRN